MRFQTLNELFQLRDSGFGRPNPRHGLNLLYWFAHEFVEMRNSCMFVPYNGLNNFGFHQFHNKIEDDDDGPLFNQLNVAPQYEVGNLNPRHQRGNKLPLYVSEKYTGEFDGSNKDRIIIRVNGTEIDRVYLTQHSNTTSFDRHNTYRVTKGLISIIRRMERTKFLQEVGAATLQSYTAFRPQVYEEAKPQSYASYPQSNYTAYREPPKDDSWWCTIL